MTPDDRDRTVAAWQQSVASGETYQCEHRVRMADGTMRWHLSRAVPVRDAQGRVVRWFGTATDIHDAKLAQEALRDADRRKSRFVATLAHELRNPLAPIRNAVGLLKRQAVSLPPAARSACDIIDRQSRHLARLVDDLLDMARISRGRLRLRREPVRLDGIVDHAREAIAAQIAAKAQSLAVRLPTMTVELNADPARLAQVLVNLLDNASKYSGEGGRIALNADLAADELVLRVSDDGIGIAADDLPKLFEMFAQVGDRTGQGGGGLGIGLALTRRLVEMHGGTIVAASAGPGQGTTLTLRLPAAAVENDGKHPLSDTAVAAPIGEPAASVPAAQSAEDIDASVAGKPCVLIADDNQDVVESMAMLLEINGYKVAEAHNGLAAVAAAEHEQPNVILLDIGMPGLDGHEACRRIRRLPNGGRFRIIALTGWGQDEDRRKSAEAGFDGHLVKPIEPGALLDLLAEVRIVLE